MTMTRRGGGTTRGRSTPGRLVGWLLLLAFVTGGRGTTAEDVASSATSTTTTTLPHTDALLAHWDALQEEVAQLGQGLAEATAAVEAQRTAHDERRATLRAQLVAYNQGELAVLQARLTAVVEAEVARRTHAAQQPPPTVTGAGTSSGLSLEQVQEILSPDTILAERDALVSAWITTLLERAMAERPVPTWEEPVVARHTATPAAACGSLLQAVDYLQEALTRYAHDDGVGLTDHARGGRIVHQATSPTYHAAAAADDTWGASRLLRDYLLPQDWEDVLPAGWQDWSTSLRTALSPSLAHSLGVASTAPPEAVLEPPVWPGACWPMAGTSGQVTFVLPYNIHPTAISIDHASPLLVADASAAPRHVRIRAYAPCDDCRGRDYDTETVYDLFPGQTIAYEIHTTPSVQTFWLPAPAKETANAVGNDEVEVGEEASCTAPTEDDDGAAGSCGATSTMTSDTLVRAVQVEILDNWGHGDYTCVYRIRVHGKPS
jgi:hypothetical protein